MICLSMWRHEVLVVRDATRLKGLVLESRWRRLRGRLRGRCRGGDLGSRCGVVGNLHIGLGFLRGHRAESEGNLSG